MYRNRWNLTFGLWMIVLVFRLPHVDHPSLAADVVTTLVGTAVALIGALLVGSEIAKPARVALLLALGCLLSASPAHAGTLEYTLMGGTGNSPSIVTPRSAYIQLQQRSDDTIIAEWRIDGIMPSLEPQVFALTEADNHPDWDVFEQATLDPEPYAWRSAFTSVEPSGSWRTWRTKPPADGPGPGDSEYFWYEMYDFERLEFTVHHWLLGVSFRHSAAVIGEGAALPEPAAGLLLVLGLCHVAMRRGR